MTRQSIALAFTLLAAAVSTPACDDRQAAQHAQDEADKAKAKALDDANKAKAEAEKAQAAADQKKAEVDAAFAKAQVDYRASVEKDLVDIDRKIADMRATASKATGATKVDYDQLLAEVTTRREAVRRNLDTVATATPPIWEGTKQTIDKSMADLKDAVRAAGDKIKVKMVAAVRPPSEPTR